MKHSKLEECIVPDFFHLDQVSEQLKGYDACFYCAGINSRGMSEEDYSYITYDTTLNFAKTVLSLNPHIVFGHISGSHTDGTETSRMMWARVKGKAENALMKMPFKKVYNFRPGFMKPRKDQQNIKGYYKVLSTLAPLLKLLFPGNVMTIQQVGPAMINSVLKGYPKQVLEVSDMKKLAVARIT